MIKTTNKALLVALVLVSFMIACTGSTSNDKDINIFVGTDGLTAEFAKTAPPPRVFEESGFPILLRIRNKGTYSIPLGEGLISIGREKDYVKSIKLEANSRVTSGVEENEAYFDIDGKTQLNPNGDEIVVTFNAETGKLEPQSESKTSTITANLCYPYKTILSTTVCIDPDIVGLRNEKKVCNVKDIALGSGQGAPIAITKIEPQMIPEVDKNIIKPQFLIFIENKAQGNPVDPSNYQSICGDQDINSKDLWNVAYLRAYAAGESGEIQLLCCPNKQGKCDEEEKSSDKLTGFLRFKDRKDFVRCTFREGTPRSYNAFTSPLRIEIDYGYVQAFATNFVIQKPLKY